MVEQSQPDPVAAKEAQAAKFFGWWPKPSKIERVLRHATALVVWGYFVCQLLLVDVDAYLKSVLPAPLTYLVEYKFLVFLLLVIALMLFAPRRHLYAWLIYISFYPLTRFAKGLLYTVVIIAALRSWAVIFTSLNLVFSFFGSFKFYFVFGTLAVIAELITLLAANSVYLFLAALLNLILVLVLVVRRFISLFRPSGLFKVYTGVMARLISYGRSSLIAIPELHGMAVATMDQKQIDTWASKLQNAVLLNELCAFLEVKFREYRNSGLPVAYYMINFFLLLAGVVILFAFAHYGLDKSYAGHFKIVGSAHWFDFFYYSFYALLLQRIPEITPVTLTAKAFAMFENSLALVLTGMVLSIFFAVKKSVDDAEIEGAIARLQTERSSLDDFVKSEFDVSLYQAIDKLETIQKGLTTFIKALRKASGADAAESA